MGEAELDNNITSLKSILKDAVQGFTPEEKQLLLEAKTIMGRSRALEALYQSYTVEETADTSTQLH